MRKFYIGEIVYLTHGVGELVIEAAQVQYTEKKIVTVKNIVSGKQFDVDINSITSSEDLPKELYNFMRQHTYFNFKHEMEFNE